MTAPRGTPEHKHLLDAASSILRRIQSRAAELDPRITIADLESALCIKPRSDTSRRGATFEKYRDGRWEGVYGTLVQKIRFASAKNWLTNEDLQELGLEDAAVTTQPADIKKNHQKAATRFMTGRQREIDGLLPVAMRGPKGRLPRLPDDEAEAAREHASWIAGIEELGGQVKIEKWAPIWYEELAYECNQRFLATNPDPPEINDEDPRVKVLLDEGHSPELLWMLDNDWPPPHHAWNVKQLNLWFGGREYSPYMHAITRRGYIWQGYADGNEPVPSLPPLPPDALQS
jgi:hypothetical protein